MLKIEVPENDQSVYELKTESGETHLIRCPGTHLDDEKEGLFCFVLEGSIHRSRCMYRCQGK